ncbi:MAG: DUF448 domain-containing protein [Pseudomonadota bacterium]
MTPTEDRHKPVRMCVICRRRFTKKELLRYVCPVEGTGPVADVRQVHPGRGWYVCGDPNCRAKMAKFGGWRRKRKGV